MEKQLPCGCCHLGCVCPTHSLDGFPVFCDYHKIQNDLDDAMRAIFAAQVEAES